MLLQEVKTRVLHSSSSFQGKVKQDSLLSTKIPLYGIMSLSNFNRLVPCLLLKYIPWYEFKSIRNQSERLQTIRFFALKISTNDIVLN